MSQSWSFAEATLFRPARISASGEIRDALEGGSDPALVWSDLGGGIHIDSLCGEFLDLGMSADEWRSPGNALIEPGARAIYQGVLCCACVKQELSGEWEGEHHELLEQVRELYRQIWAGLPRVEAGACQLRRLLVSRMKLAQLQGELISLRLSRPGWAAGVLTHLGAELGRILEVVAERARALAPLENRMISIIGLGLAQASPGRSWQQPQIQLALRLSVTGGVVEREGFLDHLLNISTTTPLGDRVWRERLDAELTHHQVRARAAADELRAGKPAVCALGISGGLRYVPERLATALAALVEESLRLGRAWIEGDSALVLLPRSAGELLVEMLEAPRREDPGMFDEVVGDDNCRMSLSWIDELDVVNNLSKASQARTYLRMLDTLEISAELERRHSVVDGTPFALACRAAR